MRIRFLPSILVVSLVFSASLAGQKNHTLDWKSGATPNVFDQMERQADGSKQATAAQLAALRREREAALADLSRELDGVIQSATELQSRLKGVDPNTVVSVELRNESKQLEDLAKKIRKQIGSL